MKSLLATEFEDFLIEDNLIDQENDFGQLDDNTFEEDLDTIEATRLNDYQQNLINRSKQYMPEYREHMYDCLFGEGNDRIYIEDRLEIKVNPKNVDVKNLINIINGCIRALNALPNTKATYDLITINNFTSGTVTKHLKQVRGVKNSEVSLTTILTTAKDIYNQLLEFRNNNKNDDEDVFEDYFDDITYAQWHRFFGPINSKFRQYDKDLKETLNYFNKINPTSILDPEHKLKVVITKNYEDVACISTGRSWSSCQALPDTGPEFSDTFFENWDDVGNSEDEGDNDFGYDSSFWHHALEDVKYGSIAAYLINSGDEDIDEPRARLSIKPLYVGGGSPSYIKNNSPLIHLEIEPYVYTDGSFGARRESYFDHLPTTVLSSFQKVVIEWVKDANEILEKDVTPGTVYNKHFAVYPDGGIDTYTKPDPEAAAIQETIIKIKDTVYSYYNNNTELPYNIGDEIKIGKDMTIVVIGKNHDLLNDTKPDHDYAALTFMLVTPTFEEGIIRDDGVRGWINSTVRVSAKNNRFSNLRLTTVKKRTAGVSNGNVNDIMITHDKIFLLSTVEVFGDTQGVTLDGEGRQYEYFATNGVPDILKGSWLRSPYIADDSSYCAIDDNGQLVPADPTDVKKYVWCLTI